MAPCAHRAPATRGCRCIAEEVGRQLVVTQFQAWMGQSGSNFSTVYVSNEPYPLDRISHVCCQYVPEWASIQEWKLQDCNRGCDVGAPEPHYPSMNPTILPVLCVVMSVAVDWLRMSLLVLPNSLLGACLIFMDCVFQVLQCQSCLQSVHNVCPFSRKGELSRDHVSPVYN